MNTGAAISGVGFTISANVALTYMLDCYENVSATPSSLLPI